ncbi:hypothetical protein [Williamsia soli]|uniref:hypothetical protein n=1 Tax=Williamsia soli TaxID=364929 RepID=UPI001A9FB8FC|nr:hypothetical protein [Williamsia soli]
MFTIDPADLEVVMQDETGFELRMRDLGDDMIVNYVKMPAGADFTAAFSLLQNGHCQCPHYGYVLRGSIYTTSNGDRTVYVAGDVFFWAPGHIPGAIEESEYVDFAPKVAFEELLDGVRRAMQG